MINVHRIISSTKAEGPGIRTCIYLQGCSHHCDGCFAMDTWSFENKNLMSVEEIVQIVLKDVTAEGVTFLGGEPLDQFVEVLELCKRIRAAGKTIILFTGYTLNEITNKKRFGDILEYVDVLVDGPYIKEQRDFSRPMVGSKNQKFVFLTDKYSIDDFGKNKIEIRINSYGMITINGQGNTKLLKNTKEIMQDV